MPSPFLWENDEEEQEFIHIIPTQFCVELVLANFIAWNSSGVRISSPCVELCRKTY